MLFQGHFPLADDTYSVLQNTLNLLSQRSLSLTDSTILLVDVVNQAMDLGLPLARVVDLRPGDRRPNTTRIRNRKELDDKIGLLPFFATHPGRRIMRLDDAACIGARGNVENLRCLMGFRQNDIAELRRHRQLFIIGDEQPASCRQNRPRDLTITAHAARVRRQSNQPNSFIARSPDEQMPLAHLGFEVIQELWQTPVFVDKRDLGVWIHKRKEPGVVGDRKLLVGHIFLTLAVTFGNETGIDNGPR